MTFIVVIVATTDTAEVRINAADRANVAIGAVTMRRINPTARANAATGVMVAVSVLLTDSTRVAMAEATTNAVWSLTLVVVSVAIGVVDADRIIAVERRSDATDVVLARRSSARTCPKEAAGVVVAVSALPTDDTRLATAPVDARIDMSRLFNAPNVATGMVAADRMRAVDRTNDAAGVVVAARTRETGCAKVDTGVVVAVNRLPVESTRVATAVAVARADCSLTLTVTKAEAGVVELCSGLPAWRTSAPTGAVVALRIREIGCASEGIGAAVAANALPTESARPAMAVAMASVD